MRGQLVSKIPYDNVELRDTHWSTLLRVPCMARSFLSSIVTCCPVSVLKAEKMSCDGDDRARTNEGRQGQYFADLVRNASRRAPKLPCASWRLLTIVYAAYRRIRRWCESEKVTDERAEAAEMQVAMPNALLHSRQVSGGAHVTPSSRVPIFRALNRPDPIQVPAQALSSGLFGP
jgi:hypothetical protein